MPVFDFKHTPDEKKAQECTYTTFRSNETEATAEKPMLVLDNSNRKWKHHSCGIFTNPIKKTSFEFDEEDGTVSADILQIDARFVSLIKWLARITSMSVFPVKTVQTAMQYTRSGRSHSVGQPSFQLKMVSCSS